MDTVFLAAFANEDNKVEKDVVLINQTPYGQSISKFNKTLIDNAGNLDIVMPIYNLLKYSHTYSMRYEICEIII